MKIFLVIIKISEPSSFPKSISIGQELYTFPIFIGICSGIMWRMRRCWCYISKSVWAQNPHHFFIFTQLLKIFRTYKRSVDPIAAPPPHAAHGPYVLYGAHLKVPSKKNLTYLQMKVVRNDKQWIYCFIAHTFFSHVRTGNRTTVRTNGRT